MGKKIYQKGDTVNFRLSKKRIKDRVVDAINEANKNDELNEFITEALDFYVKHKNRAMYINPLEMETDLVKLRNEDTKRIEPKRDITREEIKKEIVVDKSEVEDIYENDPEDELYSGSYDNKIDEDDPLGEVFSKGGINKKKGLKAALGMTRRKY